MIQLFVWAILGQMVMILILLFNTPLRNLAVMALNHLKRDAALLVAKTVAGVVFVMMSTTVYNITEIHSRPMESLNPTDQILLDRHILEAILMGFLLFLSLVIDRLHENLEAAKKQNQAMEDEKSGCSDELKVLGEEISSLKTKIKQLESECESKGTEVKAVEADV